MDVEWFTLNGLVAKGTTVSDSSPTVVYCRACDDHGDYCE